VIYRVCGNVILALRKLNIGNEKNERFWWKGIDAASDPAKFPPAARSGT
jgi:hypothetical protein